MEISTPTDQALAQVVTSRLDEAGFHWHTAADATGIPRTTFRRRAEGNSSFKASELVAIARLLEVKVSELVAEAELREAPVTDSNPWGVRRRSKASA